MSRSVAPLLEPLRFERLFLEKVWGGRNLERVPGIELPGDGLVGETWELVDRAEQNSVVAEGRLRGRTLRELMRADRRAILGRARAAEDGGFPLLIKFLDAAEALSVQVHPHRGVVERLPRGESPKTESWYILSAQPGAAIYVGLREGVDARTLAARAAGPEVVELLVKHEVCAGDFVFVPGGTVHAIGAGVTLVEVQETSDTTYRLYDWGRTGLDGKPRPVHVEQALSVIRFDGAPEGPRRPIYDGPAGSNRRARLVDCEEFVVEIFELAGTSSAATDGLALIYIVLGGSGTLSSGASSERWRLRPGDTWLVPACVDSHRIESAAGMRFMKVSTRA